MIKRSINPYFLRYSCVISLPHPKNVIILSQRVDKLSKRLCSAALCRLDPRCSHLSGLHGIRRELPSQPQYWHAAQVNHSPATGVTS